MTNWRTRETIDLGILILVAVSLFFPEGVLFLPALTEKVFNTILWRTILAIGVGWVAYSYKQIIRV